MLSASENRFSHLLATRPWLLADGATGSNLFDVGLISGDAPELWNTEHPDRLAALRRAFEATLRDPAYVEDTRKVEMQVRPLTHQQAKALVDEIVSMPPEVIAKAKAAMGG